MFFWFSYHLGPQVNKQKIYQFPQAKESWKLNKFIPQCYVPCNLPYEQQTTKTMYQSFCLGLYFLELELHVQLGPDLGLGRVGSCSGAPQKGGLQILMTKKCMNQYTKLKGYKKILSNSFGAPTTRVCRTLPRALKGLRFKIHSCNARCICNSSRLIVSRNLSCLSLSLCSPSLILYPFLPAVDFMR